MHEAVIFSADGCYCSTSSEGNLLSSCHRTPVTFSRREISKYVQQANYWIKLQLSPANGANVHLVWCVHSLTLREGTALIHSTTGKKRKKRGRERSDAASEPPRTRPSQYGDNRYKFIKCVLDVKEVKVKDLFLLKPLNSFHRNRRT